MGDIPDRWRQEFDLAGVRKVEALLRGGGYPGDMQAAALNWLAEQDAAKEALEAQRHREAMWHSKGAHFAAWAAAILTVLFGLLQLL